MVLITGNSDLVACSHQRRRAACASKKFDHHLCYLVLEWFITPFALFKSPILYVVAYEFDETGLIIIARPCPSPRRVFLTLGS